MMPVGIASLTWSLDATKAESTCLLIMGDREQSQHTSGMSCLDVHDGLNVHRGSFLMARIVAEDHLRGSTEYHVQLQELCIIK